MMMETGKIILRLQIYFIVTLLRIST